MLALRFLGDAPAQVDGLEGGAPRLAVSLQLREDPALQGLAFVYEVAEGGADEEAKDAHRKWQGALGFRSSRARHGRGALINRDLLGQLLITEVGQF